MPSKVRGALVAVVVVTASVLVGCQSSLATDRSAVRPDPSRSAALESKLAFRLGHVGAPTSLFESDAQAYLTALEATTRGRVTGASFPGSQIAGQQEMLEQVQLGALEMALSSSEMVGAVPEFGIFDLPFAFQERTQVQRALDGALGTELARLADKRNLVVLGYWENGFRHITNNRRPIRTPADLSGLRIRTPPNPDRLKMFHDWGALAAPLDFAELFSALQTGKFDGQENPLGQITGARLQEVQKYLSFSAHVYTPSYLVASKPWWDRLDADTQRVLRETAVSNGAQSRQRGEAADQAGEALVRQAGLEVNHDVDTAAFVRGSVDLYDAYRKRFGARLLDLLTEATRA
jgi:tripartite ATP-independent transporter DctP family solute receptor